MMPIHIRLPLSLLPKIINAGLADALAFHASIVCAKKRYPLGQKIYRLIVTKQETVYR
jgi:hypothetical protein